MFCKWCGLESETTDACSWCHKPFSSAKQTAPSPSTAEAEAAAAPPPSRSSGPLANSFPLGDGFADDDDDLTPMPFGGPLRASDSGPLSEPPPANFAPPVAPPGPAATPPGPPASSIPSDRPAMDAIPIKGRDSQGGNAGPAPGMIPIAIRPTGNRQAPPPAMPPPPVNRRPQAAPPGGAQGTPPTQPPPPAPFVPRPSGNVPPPPNFSALPPRPAATTLGSPQSHQGQSTSAHVPTPPAAPPRPPSSEAPASAAAMPLGAQPHDNAPASPVADSQPVIHATSAPEENGHAPVAEPENDVQPHAAPGTRYDLSGNAVPAAGSPPPPSRPGGPGAPPSPGGSNIPRAGGRTWYCRACGMQSESADNCTWCKRDMRATPAPSGKPMHVTTTKGPTSKKGPVRQPVTKTPPPPGPVAPPPGPRPNGVSAPPAASPPATPKNAPVAPQLGTFQAQKSKYYGDKVYDPVSGAHYDADSGTAEKAPDADKIITEDVNELKQLAIFAPVFAVMLGIAGMAVSNNHAAYLPAIGITIFLACFLQPAMRVTPFFSDDGGDFAIALGLMLILGPFVGAVAYAVVCVIRSDWSPGVVGVLAASLLTRMSLDLAVGKSLADLFAKMLPELTVAGFTAHWLPILGLFGWMAGDMVKKHDE